MNARVVRSSDGVREQGQVWELTPLVHSDERPDAALDIAGLPPLLPQYQFGFPYHVQQQCVLQLLVVQQLRLSPNS